MSRIYFTNKDGKIEDLRSPFKFDPTSADKIKELVKKIQGQLRKEDKPTKIKTLSNEFRIYDMGAKCWLDDDDNFAYAADCEHGLKFLLILAKDQEYPRSLSFVEGDEPEELKKQDGRRLYSYSNASIQNINPYAYCIDGLPSSNMALDRKEKVDELISLVYQQKSVLVVSPPFTGKTCLRQLFMQACSSNAVTIALAHAPRVNSLSELKDFISQSLYYAHDFVYKRELDQADDKLKIIMDPKKSIILVIDDVQLIYHLTEFWGCFKDPVQYSCNLLAFATYGASTGLGSYTTPVGMGVYLTYEFTKFKREEVLELVENVRNHKHANCLTPNIIDEIQIMTGFHAGLTVYCIQVVLNDFPKRFLPQPDSEYNEQVVNNLISTGKLFHLIKETLSSRAFRSIGDVIAFAREKDAKLETTTSNNKPTKRRSTADKVIAHNLEQLFHALIYKNCVNTYDAECDNFEKTILLKHGICVKDHNDNIFFSCPIVKLFYQTDYLKRAREILAPEYKMPESIDIFLKDVLSYFNANVLKNSKSKMQGSTVHEVAYQQEFYRVSMSLCSFSKMYSNTEPSISANVGSWFGVNGALDLYINSDVQFGFEFLVSGRGIGEHVKRVKTRYANIPMKACMVIDFHQFESEDECRQAFKRATYLDPIYYRVGFFDDFQHFIIKNGDVVGDKLATRKI